MSLVYVDTSAIFALLVASDESHRQARNVFARLAAESAPLLTTSYVLVETYALLGRRVGTEAVRAFREHIAPLCTVVWVGSELHDRALDQLLRRAQHDLSLVDLVSFEVIRERAIDRVFAFDRHFRAEGLPLLA
ncbi:MAG: PIN domain-containing protein [Deltaproteobacteria bacterium]|nr:PIN domain-containing protein [Deltaproteobacteria bacterium]